VFHRVCFTGVFKADYFRCKGWLAYISIGLQEFAGKASTLLSAFVVFGTVEVSFHDFFPPLGTRYSFSHEVR